MCVCVRERETERETEGMMEIDQLSGEHGVKDNTRKCQEARSKSNQDMNLRGIHRESNSGKRSSTICTAFIP